MRRYYSQQAVDGAKATIKRLEGKHWVGRLQKSSEQLEVTNPATLDTVGYTGYATAGEVSEAIALSKAAQPEWAALSFKEKRGILSQIGHDIDNHLDELSTITCLETGKAIRTECQMEAGLVSNVFHYYAGLVSEMKGERMPFAANNLTYSERIPIGVVGAITPWNAPLLLFALKVAPAIAAGNGIVLKSSELSPFGSLRLAEIISRSLPSGLVNVVTGKGETTGEALINHPDIGKVSFTGSVDTGRRIGSLCGEKIIPTTLELGGKSPMIVCADADLEQAINGGIASMRFTRMGQSCTAASRIFVHESNIDAFTEQFVAKINSLQIGDPLDPETDIGTMINASQYEKVKDYIALGKQETNHYYECGALPTDPHLQKGYFLLPTVFRNLPKASRLMQEEIFGPVTNIEAFSDFDEVIARANDTPFGLSASLWTRDLQLAMKGVQGIHAGIVQVNQNAVVQPNLPVGGLGISGIGKEGDLKAMLDHYTLSKTVSINFQG